MKCERARCYLSPYLDSELDPTTTYEISRHLEACPACARLFAQEAELERAILARLRRPAGDEEQAMARVLARVLSPRRRLRRAWLLTAAALIFLLGLLAARRWLERSDRSVPELVAMVAEDHARYLRGEIEPELRAADPAAVASFLGQRLQGEAGRLPQGEGWVIEGARICRFRESTIGFVALRFRGVAVSVVDVPGAQGTLPEDAVEAAASGRFFALAGGRGLVGLTATGLRAAFGDVEMVRLEEAIAAAR